MECFDYYGLALPVLEKGELPLAICLTMKVMNTDGGINYKEYKSPATHAIEALGMLETFSDTMRMAIMASAKPYEG